MKKAILIVSFGTTYPDTRQKNIAAITRQVRALYPDAVVEEAVSSTIVRNAMKKREHIEAKSPTEALESMKKQGVTHVAVFPTHVIDGIENHRLKEAAKKYAGAFEQIAVADALLAKPQDYEDVAKALWESLKEEVGDFPLILMGHGTEHAADASYAMMEQSLRAYAKHEIYIATVEGSITIKDVIARMKSGPQSRQNGKVLLTPFMLVAGDHANNDMAGGMQDGEQPDADSFAGKLQAAGYRPECVIRGIGEYPAVREVYLTHLRQVTKKLFCDLTTENRPEQPDADSFAGKLQAAGYRPECVIRGIGEYPAVREVYLTHLRQVTKKLFCDLTTENRPGILYGIGVGPGDPKLMTLQALETIRSCDLIVLPAVSKEECYAYRIVEQVCPEIADMPLLCMPFPMIKDAQKLELAHKRIYDAVEDYLRQGLRVGMLTIGDPGIYSTYMYMHRCAADAGWEARIVSGVPSFCAVAARLGISLGEKDEEIHIIPAAYDVRESLGFHGTRIYMKSGKKLEELLRVLREAMQDKESRVHQDIYGISNCGMENEQVYCGLDELEQAKGYLTTVIVKEHVVQ